MSAVTETEKGLDEVTRRHWLALCFWLAGATLAAAMTVPLVGYFLGPLMRRRSEPKVRIGRLEDFVVDQPREVQFALRVRDGWVTEEGRRAAWVVRRAEKVFVFDPRCTHLSCAYHWEAAARQFLCPCHNGLYDLDGRVVGGPPPRPLDVYPVTVEDGALFIVPTPMRRT